MKLTSIFIGTFLLCFMASAKQVTVTCGAGNTKFYEQRVEPEFTPALDGSYHKLTYKAFDVSGENKKLKATVLIPTTCLVDIVEEVAN